MPEGTLPACLVFSNPGCAQGPRLDVEGPRAQVQPLPLRAGSPRSRVLAGPPSTLGACPAIQNLPRLVSPLPLLRPPLVGPFSGDGGDSGG